VATKRFVLRFRGEGDTPGADLDQVRRLPGARVVDESSPRMVLVEAPEEPLRVLVEGLAGWVLAPERSFPLPDTRQRIEGQPG